MKKFIHQLRRVKVRDLFQIWKIIPALIISRFLRIKYNNIWIICEDKNEARDNGYHLFKYINKHHPQQKTIYAISKKSPDLNKIKEIGKYVNFGSLMHWAYYFASTIKISSQKAGNPNAAIFYLLEVYGIIKNNRVFLGHGITINDSPWLHSKNTKMTLFICGAKLEYDYILKNFGYAKSSVKYCGLCRYDNLEENHNNNYILIMPTWREWIADNDYRLKKIEHSNSFTETEYFKKWNDFINSPKIKDLSKKYGIHFKFYPHRNMQKYIQYFEANEYVSVIDAANHNIQEIMKNASMMITDYSSVFMDMIYMKKPVVFYQFDYSKFRKNQYGAGFFDYKNNPVSSSYEYANEVLRKTEEIIKSNYKPSAEYLKYHKQLFALYDHNNCKRTYEEISKLNTKEKGYD